MPKSPVAVLPVADRERLQALAQQLSEQMHPLASLLSGKLSRSEWCEADEFPELTVVLDRFVTYRIDGSAQPERRLLIDPADGMWPPAELSVATPLGITLLGLSMGDRVRLIGADVRVPPWVEVMAVGVMASRRIARCALHQTA